MRITGFVISLTITTALVWLLNNSQKVNTTSIPALGSFLSPSEGFWANAEPTDFSLGDFKNEYLSESVEIFFDERRVPHIFANNLKDAIFAQGYVTASDRLWQMDISTRSVSGRLSEIIDGEAVLKRDKLQRRLGMVFAAENTLAAWEKDKEGYELIEAYTAGVNAYIQTLAPKDYPLEFKLLGYKPEAWTPLKSALFVKAMAASLCLRETDLQATNTLELLGKDRFDFLFPPFFEEQEPIIPKSVTWDFEPIFNETVKDSTNNSLGMLPYEPVDLTHPKNGSNNWAVSGSKTASGKPILCGDPHLGLTLPAIWYEIQIHTPQLNTYGASLPGMPSVIIGFNEHIAWSQTNVGHDVADWFAITWKDDTKKEYLLDGKYLPVEEKIETYHAKQGIIYDTVKYTKWGPITHESESSAYKDLAFKWLAHQAPTNSELQVFFKLNKAKNYDDYYDALKGYASPPQNYAFASTEGDIAIRVQGKFPLKRENQGRFVLDGSTSDNDWKGFIPHEHNPAVKNPERGFIASANQHSTAPNYPYYYNKEYFESFRGRTVVNYLSKMDSITVTQMKELQNNNFNLEAAEAIPVLMNYIDTTRLNSEELGYLKTLGDWNYFAEADLEAPVLYQLWSQDIYKQLWDEFYALDNTLVPHDIRTIHFFRDTPTDDFYDNKSTPQVETASDIVMASFKNAVLDFDARKTKNKGSYTWSEYRQPQITHMARSLKPFDRKVNVGGDGSALNANTGTFGPSWRMVVHLDTPIKAWVVYPGGQSGNPGSKHYDDFINAWENGTYFESKFYKSKEDAKILKNKMTLSPN